MQKNTSDTAWTVDQYGAGDIVNFRDGGTTVFAIADGGIQTSTIEDGTTNAAVEVLRLIHNTTGTPANGLGTGIRFDAETSTTESVQMGRLSYLWSTVAHATRTSVATIDLINGGSSLTEIFRFRIGFLGFEFNGNVTSGNYEIGRDADSPNQLHFNVPTGASFEFSVQNAAEVVITASDVDLTGNTLSNIGAAGTDIGASTATFAQLLSVDDTTESTSTTTGSIHTDGGLGVVGDIYAGDDIFFATGAVLNFNAGDVTITHSANVLTFGGGTLDMGSNAINNIAAAGNDFIANEITLSSSNSGANQRVHIENTSNTASSDALLHLAVGGTSGGDPHIRFQIAGVDSMVMGLDNTDDSFTWATGTVLGTNNILVMAFNGSTFAFQQNVTFSSTGTLTINAFTAGGTINMNSNVFTNMAALDMNNTAISNVGAAGNDWNQNDFTLAGGSGSQTMTVQTTGTAGVAAFRLILPATGVDTSLARFIMQEGNGGGTAGNMQYIHGYDPVNNRWYLESFDTNGSALRGGVIRIPDGQLTIDADATWDDNVTFDDYDDAMVLYRAFSADVPRESPVVAGRKLLKRNRRELIDMGVLRLYEDGWIGESSQRWTPLLAGGIYQNREKIDALIIQVQYLTKENLRLKALVGG